MTTNAPTVQRRAAYNRRLAKKRVQWLIEHSTSYQILCWVDSLVLRNPLLRQAPKRCVQHIFRTYAESFSPIFSERILLKLLPKILRES